MNLNSDFVFYLLRANTTKKKRERNRKRNRMAAASRRINRGR